MSNENKPPDPPLPDEWKWQALDLVTQDSFLPGYDAKRWLFLNPTQIADFHPSRPTNHAAALD